MIVHETATGVRSLAPAKLNLFLEVLGKRPDGYHELETLMVTVDLCDVLTCDEGPKGEIVVTCDDPSLPTGPENLVTKAALRLREAAGIDRGAVIDLKKSIPAQAGLGGGSSDAALTLVALDRLWNLQTPPDQLDALAGAIGSDVVFFLHAPAAICRGRGERVEPIALPRTLHFVLVCPPFGSKTADVYRHLKVPVQPRPIGPLLEALGNPDALGRCLFNRLQGTAERLHPELTRVRDALATAGPGLTGYLMSGSGSACFGLTRDRETALAIAHQLSTLGLGQVRAVTSDLETSPA